MAWNHIIEMKEEPMRGILIKARASFGNSSKNVKFKELMAWKKLGKQAKKLGNLREGPKIEIQREFRKNASKIVKK